MTTTDQTPPAAYFGSLTIENVKCFKGEHTIDLSDGNSKPAMWTVILGNNNMGKTTILRCLADLEAILDPNEEDDENIVSPAASIKFFNNLIHNFGRVSASILLNNKANDEFERYENWNFHINKAKFRSSIITTDSDYTELGGFIIYGYGTSRKMSNTSLLETENQYNTANLFDDTASLINAEEWIIQIDYAIKNGIESAKFRLNKIKEILTNGLLPDVKDFRCTSQEINNQIKNFVEFKTDYGWVKLKELGYGYQVTLAWIVDLAKKLFERYPNSENPLHEPAIVLVDELDLHLHPEWQRKIISFLSKQFPKTQFIATTHSPLIIQSADNINLVILEKQDDHVIIKQPDIKTFKGWTVDEILTELMGLDDKTLSDDYLKLIKQFDDALDNDNYQQAKNAYDELDKILHPNSHQRKLLRIQMASLSRD